uniref:(northern house mosquito) hypothetical protein n=1 Tax=Culex pipiens TaxID=7175 RepID=A0A8D8CRJ0_CULPI
MYSVCLRRLPSSSQLSSNVALVDPEGWFPVGLSRLRTTKLQLSTDFVSPTPAAYPSPPFVVGNRDPSALSSAPLLSTAFRLPPLNLYQRLVRQLSSSANAVVPALKNLELVLAGHHLVQRVEKNILCCSPIEHAPPQSEHHRDLQPSSQLVCRSTLAPFRYVRLLLLPAAIHPSAPTRLPGSPAGSRRAPPERFDRRGLASCSFRAVAPSLSRPDPGTSGANTCRTFYHRSR